MNYLSHARRYRRLIGLATQYRALPCLTQPLPGSNTVTDASGTDICFGVLTLPPSNNFSPELVEFYGRTTRGERSQNEWHIEAPSITNASRMFPKPAPLLPLSENPFHPSTALVSLVGDPQQLLSCFARICSLSRFTTELRGTS